MKAVRACGHGEHYLNLPPILVFDSRNMCWSRMLRAIASHGPHEAHGFLFLDSSFPANMPMPLYGKGKPMGRIEHEIGLAGEKMIIISSSLTRLSGRLPPSNGRMISIPGDRSQYVLVERVEEGRYATGEGWWKAYGTDDKGEPRTISSDDELVKARGFQNYGGPRSEFHVQREQRLKGEQEQKRRQAAEASFLSKYKIKPGQVREVLDSAREHPEMGAFLKTKVRVMSIDYQFEKVKMCSEESPDLCLEVPAALAAAYTISALPAAAASITVSLPSGEKLSLGDLIERIPDLSGYVSQGLVGARAMVYVNAKGGRGEDVFEAHMGQLGAQPEEGVHYVLNDTGEAGVKEPYFAYTGEVILRPIDLGDGRRGIPKDVLDEIRPLIDPRGSQMRAGTEGGEQVVKIYNNPLFRAVVGLGVWR